MAARVRTDPRTPQLKQLATSFLENGVKAMAENPGSAQFSLDVTGLPRRERNKVRMHINRWLRDNGWQGATRYHHEERETLTVRILGPREENDGQDAGSDRADLRA